MPPPHFAPRHASECARRPHASTPTGTSAGPALAFALATLLIVSAGCSLTPSESPEPTDATARQALIERLEAEVAADRETLATIVTQPRDVDANPLHDDPEIRAIADRLTMATRRLDALRESTEAGAAE